MTVLPKAFRKHWPRKTAIEQRAFRAARRDGPWRRSGGVVRRSIGKWTQSPLGEVIADKPSRRARLRASPRKSAEARALRAARRGRAG